LPIFRNLTTFIFLGYRVFKTFAVKPNKEIRTLKPGEETILPGFFQNKGKRDKTHG